MIINIIACTIFAWWFQRNHYLREENHSTWLHMIPVRCPFFIMMNTVGSNFTCVHPKEMNSLCTIRWNYLASSLRPLCLSFLTRLSGVLLSTGGLYKHHSLVVVPAGVQILYLSFLFSISCTKQLLGTLSLFLCLLLGCHDEVVFFETPCNQAYLVGSLFWGDHLPSWYCPLATVFTSS